MDEELEQQDKDIWIKNLLVALHPLSNIEIIRYFNYEPRFYGVFSKNNFPGINDGAYVINLDDKKVKKHIGFHYLLIKIRLYVAWLF